jgi:hypothetical protein
LAEAEFYFVIQICHTLGLLTIFFCWLIIH